MALCAISSAAKPPEIHPRWNQAGYTPERAKSILVMTSSDLAGRPWSISKVDTDASTDPVLEGRFLPSTVGAGPHTPLPFNHLVDFSSLRDEGRYRFQHAETTAEIRIAADPYAHLHALPLRHLRAMRSGSHDTLLRTFSHPGDARAVVHVPDGDPAQGRWKPATPHRTVDALGGWYDAGDQIKFTLNIAYTTYHLLLAYELAPESFAREHARLPIPDILDEARHGLEFLARTLPDADTFVIQVGDALDHKQAHRLPEDDPLDGRRPALCALSRVHMASAVAALARGARTFHDIQRHDDATRWASAAHAIHERMLGPGTIGVAFERDTVNDFYRDPTEDDQRVLAAVEMHRLTGDEAFLRIARAFDLRAGREVSWTEWHWLAHASLAAQDTVAAARLREETNRYRTHARESGQPWGIPGRYTWASLHRWIGAANATRIADALLEGTPAISTEPDVFDSTLDYTFGRNNWGVSFLFAESLPNSVREIYNPTYHLLGAFPVGALSEGPGDRRTHDGLKRYFRPRPANDPAARFNTTAAVFHDDAGDFMCQESTIVGQADIVLMLTLARLPATRSGK
ncbi:glycoside hydrolase family 9 protein [Opitutales bacterium ASA1]|nr:glycoside hydrolase family 9 protein [Opitutales bacterium ASA1]